jgi:hypothetical protein
VEAGGGPGQRIVQDWASSSAVPQELLLWEVEQGKHESRAVAERWHSRLEPEDQLLAVKVDHSEAFGLTDLRGT